MAAERCGAFEAPAAQPEMLDGAAGDSAIEFGDHTTGNGAEVFAAADRM
jgi:hypothetical protein